MSYQTPNMGLLGISIGVDSGITIETNYNANMAFLDQHDHSAGGGVQITPSGININANLPFNNNAATSMAFLGLVAQGTGVTSPVNGSIYASGVDVYFQDFNGNQIQLTANGTVNATSSGISSGTASAAFSTGVLVVNSDTNTPGNIQVASISLGNIVAGSKFLTLNAPAALAASFSMTFPVLPASIKILTLDTSGNISTPFYIDGSTITVVGGNLQATASALVDGVTTTNTGNLISVRQGYITYEFKANGNYAFASPANNVDGLCFFNYNATIVNAWAWIKTPGASGTTTVDLKIATAPGGGFTTIFSTKPAFASTAGTDAYADCQGVVTPGTGVTAGVLSTTSITAGTAMRFDITGSMVNPDSCGITVQFRQR